MFASIDVSLFFDTFVPFRCSSLTYSPGAACASTTCFVGFTCFIVFIILNSRSLVPSVLGRMKRPFGLRGVFNDEAFDWFACCARHCRAIGAHLSHPTTHKPNTYSTCPFAVFVGRWNTKRHAECIRSRICNQPQHLVLEQLTSSSDLISTSS